MSNLVQLCSFHHKLVHEGGYRVQIGPDASPEFRRPDGAAISRCFGTQPASGAGIAAQNQSRGMAVGPDTCRPLSAGDRLDYGMAVEGLLWRELGPQVNTPIGDWSDGGPGYWPELE
jgi:hypothetical protein